MARLAGVDLPREKRMEIALTYIFGVGRTRALESSLPPASRRTSALRDLTDEELSSSASYIEGNYKVEGDLRREVAADIRRKVEIGCYQASGTAAVCPYVGSGPRPTRVPARARSGPSPARRSPARSN